MTTQKEQNEIELRRRLLESFPDLADFNWCWDNVKLYFIQEGKLQAISEFIKWLNFEFDKIDIISKERGNSEKVRFLFCSDLMDKREELKQIQEQVK